MHDLVIRGGTVVDGSGRPARTADVAIDDGRIAEIGDDVGAARREIDADGLLVTPGWVDIHSHYDGQSLWDPLLVTSAAHGVTTVVMGNCGVGFAPVRPEDRAWTIALMEGVEDIPAAVLDEGLSWGWESFPEYLDALEASPHAIDIAAQVPHAAAAGLRHGRAGHRPRRGSRPTRRSRVMGALAAESHRGRRGRLQHLALAEPQGVRRPDHPYLLRRRRRAARDCRGHRAHRQGRVRDQRREHGRRRRLRLMRRICEVSGRPLSAALLQRGGQPSDNYRRVLDGFADAARPTGWRMRGQVAPRPDGPADVARRPGAIRSPAHRPTRSVAAATGPDLLAELGRSELKEKHPVRARGARRT